MDTNTNYKSQLIAQIIAQEDEEGCWNRLGVDDPRFKEWNYYVPNYSSTLWTLVFLADINYEPQKARFLRPLQRISDYFFKEEFGIFTIGKSHFPIPCLNGNMLYLHNYFDSGNDEVIARAVHFFSQYQRFDDGDFRTPTKYPYFGNKSCYGSHTCYWGVVKLFKGVSFLPASRRSGEANTLIGNCIDFVLKHQVCFSSKDCSRYLSKNIELLTFPNMYRADFLEILWLLKREGVPKQDLEPALSILRDKNNEQGTWEVERVTKNLVVPFGKRPYADKFVTERAQEVLAYYE